MRRCDACAMASYGSIRVRTKPSSGSWCGALTVTRRTRPTATAARQAAAVLEASGGSDTSTRELSGSRMGRVPPVAVDQPRVRATLLHQLLVRSALDDLALRENDDLVGVADRAQPVGDDQAGAAAPAQALVE